MTTLLPMRRESYPAYVEAAIAGYAEDNVASGRWPKATALERARADIESLLPQGLDTPDNFLYEILERAGGSVIGFLWFAVERRHGDIAAYLYDLEIKPPHRRNGHALRALQALERAAVARGALSIGLNVFASNAGAQALYRKLGYVPTNLDMRKRLK